jgi:hypothetical protein
MILPFYNPLRVPETYTGEGFAGYAKLPQSVHLAMMLGVKKWRLTGTFNGRDYIDEPEEDGPFTRIITGAASVDLLYNLPGLTDDEAVAHMLSDPDAPNGAGWVSEGSTKTGDILLAAGGGAAPNARTILSSTAGVPFCALNMTAVASADGSGFPGNLVSINRTGGGTIEIKAFGQTYATPADLGGVEEGEESDEPDLPPASGVVLEATEYRTFGGRFSATTGGPA